MAVGVRTEVLQPTEAIERARELSAEFALTAAREAATA